MSTMLKSSVLGLVALLFSIGCTSPWMSVHRYRFNTSLLNHPSELDYPRPGSTMTMAEAEDFDIDMDDIQELEAHNDYVHKKESRPTQEPANKRQPALKKQAQKAVMPITPVPAGKSDDIRAGVVESARMRLGHDGHQPADFVNEILEENGVHLGSATGESPIHSIYRSIKGQGWLYDRERPLIGDVVFFHNTTDSNHDNINNDWYTMVGIVETVENDGTIAFITPFNGTVKRCVMNLMRPQVRRDETESKIHNDFLRIKRMSDPEYTQYLAGELYAGFGGILPDSIGK